MILSQELQVAWPCYRLFTEGKITLTELDTLSIDDIERANDALDAVEDAKVKMAEMKVTT